MTAPQIGAVQQDARGPWLHVANLAVFLALLAAANGAATLYLLDALSIPGARPPWAWPAIAAEWHAARPGVVRTGVFVALAGSLLALFAFAGGLLLKSRRGTGLSGLHGTAHWATPREIARTGLLPDSDGAGDGVYVGGWADPGGKLHYLRHRGPEHVLAFAPTRSGKGVGLVLPTLLSWPHSVVVYDPKGEAWALTSGWRQRHANQLVLRFDPASPDPGGAAFNPLAEIRLRTPREVGDAQNVATILVDPDGKGLKGHWEKTSQALLSGAILHCCYAVEREERRAATLADVQALFSDPERAIDDVLAQMLTYEHVRGAPHPMVAQEARTMLNKEDKELSSVVSTAVSYLTLYRDPIIAANTSRSDFKIKDLMHHDKPLSLYVVVQPPDADRLRPLVRLLVTQITRGLMDKLDYDDGQVVAHYKHRLLLLLDEFASLKRLPAIEEGIAYMAGFGIKVFLIIQDLMQLLAVYGREESLLGNCHVRIAYAPNKIETAELISKMSGQQTIVRKQTSLSGKRGSFRLTNASESVQEVQRPLLTPDEAMRLPAAVKRGSQIVEPGHLLVFCAGHAPIYGRQLLYFRDPTFSVRSKIPPPEASDCLLRGRPAAGPPPDEEGDAA